MTTETFLAEDNPSYQKTMSTAVKLAVQKAMESDKVIGPTFLFLSMCAPQPIHQDVVVTYIMIDTESEFRDEDMIRSRINRCSLFLFEETKSGDYIWVHRVVNAIINAVIEYCAETEKRKFVFRAVASFSNFIDAEISRNELYQESLTITKNNAPHLATLIDKIEQLSYPVANSDLLTMQKYLSQLENLGKVCQNHCEFCTALEYFDMALQCVDKSEVLRRHQSTQTWVLYTATWVTKRRPKTITYVHWKFV